MSSLPSPALAALLSFIFPGLGQFYAGARQRGALLALPWLVLLLAVLWLVLGDGILGIISSGSTMLAALVFLLAVFFYHVAAIVDAYGVAAGQRRWAGAHTPPYALAVVALLVAVLVVPYGVAEVYGLQANDTFAAVFRGDEEDEDDFIPDFEEDPTATPADGSPSPSPTSAAPASPSSPGASPDPTDSSATPTAVPPQFGPIDAPWAENGRLDLLLVGADAGPGRSSVRTDTMILLSVEIETGEAAMFGFPRNMINVPLPEESRDAYPGGVFPEPELLSALWRRAAEQPDKFRGSEGVGSECQHDFACERGWRALSGAIQNLAGVPIDGIIAVDLNGFALLVDAVGGIWIDVPAPVVDDNYPNQHGERIRIDIKAGCQRLNGTLALAYARSRHQDSDYQRMRRQQFVLTAIRRQFDPLALLPRVPELLNIARDNLFTTVNRDDIPLMAQVAKRVDADRMHQIRFQQQVLRHVTPESVRTMRERVRNVFDEPLPEPTPTPARGQRCPPR